MRARGFLLFSLVLLFASGCVSLSAGRITQCCERPADCLDLFNRLDRAVQKAGVLDAAAAPVPGFPYLRANRFLAGLGKSLKGEAGKRQWVRWMQELDLRARRKEIENLPRAAFVSLSGKEETQGERERLPSRVASVPPAFSRKIWPGEIFTLPSTGCPRSPTNIHPR